MDCHNRSDGKRLKLRFTLSELPDWAECGDGELMILLVIMSYGGIERAIEADLLSFDDEESENLFKSLIPSELGGFNTSRRCRNEYRMKRREICRIFGTKCFSRLVEDCEEMARLDEW